MQSCLEKKLFAPSPLHFNSQIIYSMKLCETSSENQGEKNEGECIVGIQDTKTGPDSLLIRTLLNSSHYKGNVSKAEVNLQWNKNDAEDQV